MALLVVSASYCVRNTIRDFRRADTTSGIWGLVSLAGTLSCLALGAFILLLSLFYH